MFYIYLNVVIFLPNAYQTANTLANGDKFISFGAVFCPKMCKCRLLHMAPHMPQNYFDTKFEKALVGGEELRCQMRL